MKPPIPCRDDDPRWYARFPHPHLAEYLAREGPETTFRSLGWPGWGLLYHVAVAFLRPDEDNSIVELGTDVGLSTIVLTQALVDFTAPVAGGVYSFEADPERAAEARRRIERAGLAGRAMVFGEPFGADAWIPSGIAFAFIDFTKNEALNRIALDRCYAALRPGGALLFDNSETRGVAAVIAEAEARGLTVVHLPHASWGFWPPPESDRGGTPGMALIVKPRTA